LLLAVLFSMIAFQDSEELYHVVLTNKKVMKIQAPPECEGRLCTITLASGEVTSLPASLIDREATEKLNDQRAEAREAARMEAEAAAAAAEEARMAREAEAAEREPIVLEVDDELPVYERPPNTPVAETTDGTAGDPVEPAQTQTFSSNNPVYVSSETITRYPDHTVIEATVSVNSTTGAEQIEVTLKVNYDREAADTFTRTIARRMALSETQVLSFRIGKTDRITKTAYEVTGQVPATP